MAGALVSFVGAALAIRMLSGHVGVFEINLIRTGGALLLLSLILVGVPRLAGELRPGHMDRHLPRNLVHAIGGLFWTLAVTYPLPLATVFSLEFTAPAWAALLAYPLLGERIRRQSVLGILACMVGVLVILRPSPVSFDATSILPLGAALCFGTTVLLTRRLTRTESTFAILYWMMVIQAAFNAVGTVIYPSGDLSQIGRDPMLVGAAGLLVISGLSSQFCLAKALQIGEAVMVLSLDFLRVPIIAVIGWWLYGERLDGWVFAGFAIIAAGIVVGLTPRTRARPMVPSPVPSGGEALTDGP
ncbi:DMT family transporter [Prosthecomicrobium sp. N25]|uniref:DMT family transporter n=1 Tax=Prosthecomicrobium sp. N25 TaxID=3129254 RepID=UPI0030778EF8